MISTLRQKHKLEILLEVTELAPARYYYHVKRLAAPDKYSELVAEIQAIYAEHKGRVGYRCVTLALHQRGYIVNHKTVQRLMRQYGIVCYIRMNKYKSYKGDVGKIAPNLLERNFSRDIVSYAIYEHPVLNMVTEMLEKAFEIIPHGTNLILHSDQGWHYQHKQYQRLLREKGIWQRTSRKGNCLDNAVTENFLRAVEK